MMVGMLLSLCLVFLAAISPARAENPFAYAAVQDTVTGRLEADLNTLIITPDSQAILELVRDNKELLTASPDHASLAVIALRRSGHADVAIALAERVLLEYGHHRRLDFERAVTYWSLGRCHVATPLLQRLITGDDPVSRESRLFLASCDAMQRWRWDFISSAGYDDNLGKTAPRRAIRPEVGSVYHTLFESLEGFIDLPERISLGDKPVGGIWLGLHPGLLRHRERDNGVDTLRLGVDLRAANRSGYEHSQIRINFNRWRQHGFLNSLVTLEGRHGRVNTGRHRPHLIINSIGSELQLGADLPRHFNISASLISNYEESLSHSNSRLQSEDIRLTLDHRRSPEHGDAHTLAALGWSVFLQQGEDKARPAYQSGDRQRFGAQIGPLPFDLISVSDALLTIDFSHEEKRFDVARPWLRAQHQDKTVNIGLNLTYPLSKGRSLSFRINHRDVSSPDPLDNEEKWEISMIFRH